MRTVGNSWRDFGEQWSVMPENHVIRRFASRCRASLVRSFVCTWLLYLDEQINYITLLNEVHKVMQNVNDTLFHYSASRLGNFNMNKPVTLVTVALLGKMSVSIRNIDKW